MIPIILCGGAGSRLWPVSRELHPKPFIRLADGESLLGKAYGRAAGLAGTRAVVTVTNGEFFFLTRDAFEASAAARLPATFLLEPFPRGTAAAVAAAALAAARAHGADTPLLVLPADHLIADAAAFGAAVARAGELAAEGRLVTFGIRPTAPETGYGYLETEGERVLRFVEKPSREVAEGYVRSGRFLWNSGMFCFTAATLESEMARHCPEVLEAARRAVSAGAASEERGAARLALDGEALGRSPDISLDYALMERSDRVGVVPCDIGWSDIGSWNALGELVPADGRGNRVEGRALLHEADGCYVRGQPDRVVGLLGVRDLVVVDTPDALLVADASRAQEVKHLYARLKGEGDEAARIHRTVHRPWGAYTILGEGPGHKIKRIVVHPGASLSLQSHRRRSEHWVVVSGRARVVNGDRDLDIGPNESTFIPAGNRHRLANETGEPLEIIEVQTGDYLGEDDIVRYDDRYGRA